MEALQDVYGAERPVIWCGHDRGARVGHRLLVDNNAAHNLRAAILMDIVPTLAQWRAFANPSASVGYWHWPFLANDGAPQIIEGMGGGVFVDNTFNRVKGSNEAALARFKEHHAVEVYCRQFSGPECIAGSCADYHAGARADPHEQEADQREGRKVTVPTLVMYSAKNLGRMCDVAAVWREWCEGELKTYAVTNDIGHFIPEEDPETTAKQVIEWIEHVGL